MKYKIWLPTKKAHDTSAMFIQQIDSDGTAVGEFSMQDVRVTFAGRIEGNWDKRFRLQNGELWLVRKIDDDWTVKESVNGTPYTDQYDPVAFPSKALVAAVFDARWRAQRDGRYLVGADIAEIAYKNDASYMSVVLALIAVIDPPSMSYVATE